MSDDGAPVLKSEEIMRTCPKCVEKHYFTSIEQERSHNLEYHSTAFLVRFKNNAGSEYELSVQQADGAFPCPICQELFITKAACRRHLQITCGAQYQVEDHIEQVLSPGTIPDVLVIPAVQPSTTETLASSRDYDSAILSACHKENQSSEEKRKAISIIEALKLKPFVLKDQFGVEQYALAHATVVDRLAIGQVCVCATNIPQKKRRLEDKAPSTYSPNASSGLEQLMAISPYGSALLSRTFVELDRPMCDLLNEDWAFQPHLQYACAQVLAGSIFLNTRNGQAVINNTVEVYGRTRTVDAHRERFFVKDGVASRTSLPPATKVRYRDVWPLTLPDTEGERLLLGTQSFNALVTSSLRLDLKAPASIGAHTSSFRLLNSEDSAATHIYLDKESVTVGLSIARNKDAYFISARNKLQQLRQLGSKFYDSSTYRLCRASGYLTLRHACNPYTVFTLANFNQSSSKDGQAASTLFQDIAEAVLSLGSKAVLRRDALFRLRAQCLADGNVGMTLDKIIASSPADQEFIPVIGNVILNAELEGLAQVLSSYISTANKSVGAFVQECFSIDT
ncbi:hypothetical protein BG011_001758 [Mortierella polycephala]|uniref:Uncharacterized protein n=1 Tax=Mortierella polycephala TaxID=41804 RepID=A0A9P6PL32_9FUNG|nr:hypothetical protein BG011_001758 [Mortierella polycephala]